MSVKISSLNTASTINSGDDINIAGNNPLAFSDWGGGWFMQDSAWIRSYNNKSLWMNAGLIGGDGGLTIGYGGVTPPSGGAIIAGNVGIGTSSPSARLSLGAASQGQRITWEDYSNIFSEYSSGDLWLSSNFYGVSGSSGYKTSITATYGAAGISVSGTGGGLNGVLKFFADDAASKTAGDAFTPTERMRITGGGNVGIGTTSPGAKLEINAASGSPILRVAGGGDGSGGGKGNIRSSDQGGSNFWDLGRDNLTTGNFMITPNSGTPSLSITVGGNVGIGTTSPSYRLTVANSAGNSSVNIGGGNSNTVPALSIQSDSVAWNSSTNGFAYYYNATNGNLDLYRKDNSATENQVMTWVRASGNVGIGTTTPATTLDVAGTISNNSSQNIIYSSYDNVAALFQRVGTYGGVVRLGRSGVSNSTTIDYPADGTFAVSTAGSERLRITSAGNVGIGITTPGDKLVIDGTDVFARVSNSSTGDGGIKISYQNSNTHGLHLLYNPGSAISYIDNTYPISSGQVYGNMYFRQNVGGTMTTRLFIKADGGNVGIGTSSPATTLHVAQNNGAITLTRESGLYGTKIAQSNSDGSINYQIGLATAGTWSTYMKIGEGETSPPLMLQPYGNNVLIGTTTDAGYKLDVNGTARVQGQLVVNHSLSGNYGAVIYNTSATGEGLVVRGGSTGSHTSFVVQPYDGSVALFSVVATGATTFSSLAGTGSRMVVADASGVLSTQTIPSGVSGSGTTDYLPKWTGASDLGDSIISEGSGIINVAGNVRTNNTNGILTLSNGNTSGGNKIQSWNTASNADGYLAFEGYTIEYGRFDASGQLGIGTTTPVTALDVVGGAYTNTTAKFGNTKPIYIINDDPHIGFNTYYNSGWKYGAGSSSNFAGTLGCAQTTGDFTLQTSTAGGNAGNAVTLVALMTWKQNGYVGIGTTSPGAKLEVNSNSTLPVIRARYSSTYYTDYDSNGIDFRGSTQTFDIKDNGTVAIRIASGGNVGIGTTSPLNLLHVSQASANTIFRLGNNASYDQFIYFNGGNDWSLGMDYSNSNAFVLSNASSIGTNDRLVVTTGGNVGIGTTAPEFLLDVAGGNARINGVMVGKGSNSVSTNLAVGVNPLYSNTSGSENTAIGYLTMYSTTTAIRNTALGNNALYSNTTGASNVAVGVGSLYSNTVGRYNSSVGYNSMQFMRGEYNSALGRDSMRGSLTAANNTGEYNTAVGYESMLLLTSGNWNTAVGNQAGTNLSTGSYNTFIGRSTVAAAGGLVTTGSNNTIIGGYAGTTTLASTVVLADGAGQVQLWATGKNVALGTTSPTTYANYTTLHIAGQTTTAGGVLRLTTSDSSIAVNIFTNNAGANYDTTTSHSHLFNINGASSLIVSSSGIETAGSITTADPGLGAAAWKLGDVQNATVSLITSQYVEVVIGGSSYQLALVQLE